MNRNRPTSEHERPTPCPHCGYLTEASTAVGHSNKPRPGSVTVCFKCGGVSEFTETMALVPFDVSKLDPEAAALVKRARSLIGGRKPS